MSIDKMEAAVNTVTKRNLAECRRWLNEQYGSNYTLVSHRVVLKGGFLGFMQKEYVEADYYVTQPRTDRTVSSAGQSATDRTETVNSADVAALQVAVLEQMKELRNSIGSKIDNMASVAAAQANDKHPSVQKIEELLAENEFTLSYINAISNRIREEFPLTTLDDFDSVQRTVVDWIGQGIAISPRGHRKTAVSQHTPHVIVLVGPTGVGKTTTIAKLASNLILEAKRKGEPRPRMRMITIDRTRVGALEQLRRYGEIMQTGVDAAETTEDIRHIFETNRDSTDALFIDTSGYSPNDYENIGKMRALLDVPGLTPDVYLTVTASTKARDLLSIIQNYEPFAFQSVIVTKCDETSSYGNILSVLSEKRKKIAYITDGQNAARNIEPASVVYFLTRLHGFAIDRVHIDDTFTGDN